MKKNNHMKIWLSVFSIFCLPVIFIFSNYRSEASVEVGPPVQTQQSSAPAQTDDGSQTSEVSAESSSESDQQSSDGVDLSVLHENETLYQVQKKQTLWEISQSTGMDIADLMKRNQLTSTFVYEGQYLIVSGSE